MKYRLNFKHLPDGLLAPAHDTFLPNHPHLSQSAQGLKLEMSEKKAHVMIYYAIID